MSRGRAQLYSMNRNDSHVEATTTDREKPLPQLQTRGPLARANDMRERGTAVLLTLLTAVALVLTAIIVFDGATGDGGGSLALVTINATGFAKFTPPTIVAENVTTSSDSKRLRRAAGRLTTAMPSEASPIALQPTRVRIVKRDIISDLTSDVGSIETAVSSAVSSAESGVESVASVVESAAASAASAVESGLSSIEDDIVDELDEIEADIVGALNDAMRDVTDELADLDVPRQISVHVTKACVTFNSTDSTKTSCVSLFSGNPKTDFNATANNGTIFGFQPGETLATFLNVFYVPSGIVDDARDLVANATNDVDKDVQTAEADAISWVVKLLLLPVFIIYFVALLVMLALFCVLLLAAWLAFARGQAPPAPDACRTCGSVPGVAAPQKTGGNIPARVWAICALMSAGCTFLLLVGSVILTVLYVVVRMINFVTHFVDIDVASGHSPKYMSWAACICMAVVTVLLKGEEYLTIVKFWWQFLGTMRRQGLRAAFLTM